jgi:alpha-glucoside transport system substrate-binding protein
MRTSIARLARILTAFGLCAVSAGCGGSPQNAAVSVIVPWAAGSNEYSAFQAVIKPFEDQEHVQVILESTQAVTQQLDADLAAGDRPDVVDLPSPAAVRQYEKRGGLQPLNDISLSSYDEPWRSLAESEGTVYAVPVKADVKSLIWYNAGILHSPRRPGRSFRTSPARAPPGASGWPRDRRPGGRATTGWRTFCCPCRGTT